MKQLPQSRKKILVIDDDPSMRALKKRQLEDAGYAVLLAEDGIVGGRLALNASPNLILSTLICRT